MKVIFELKDGRKIEKKFMFMDSEEICGKPEDISAYLQKRGDENYRIEPLSQREHNFDSADIEFITFPAYNDASKNRMTLDEFYDYLNSDF